MHKFPGHTSHMQRWEQAEEVEGHTHLSDLIFFNHVHGYVADGIQGCL